MQPEYTPMLFLPSLSSDDFITIANIPYEEAIEYVRFFDGQVADKRKLGNHPNPVSELLEEFKGKLSLRELVEDGSIADLVEVLSTSTIPKQRGRRAVFVDVENDIIAVGTTVVFNRNWAMRGVSDPSIPAKVLAALEDTE